jgi:hypothetical protein
VRLRPAGARSRLRSLGRGKPTEYREYLDIQLRRTLSKRSTDPGAGMRVLIDRIVPVRRRGAMGRGAAAAESDELATTDVARIVFRLGKHESQDYAAKTPRI